MIEIVEINPCPFCGSNDTVKSHNYPWIYRECISCGATGPISRDEREATDKWNIRRKNQYAKVEAGR